MSIKPLTPGRLQMALFLARKSDWVLVSDVFKHANDEGATPEGITSLSGARKALREMKYIELKNITPTGRPNYECRLIPTLTTLQKLIAAFKHDPTVRREFMRSRFYRDMIPVLIDLFNASLPDLELSLCDIGMGRLSDRSEKTEEMRKAEGLSDDVRKLIDNEMKPITSFSDASLKQIKLALKVNWSMLRFIVHYLSVDGEMRKELMLKATHDAITNNPPAEIHTVVSHILEIVEDTPGSNVGLVRDAANSVLGYTPHTHQDTLNLCRDPLTETLGNASQRMWFFSLFDQIEYIRNRYPFLFD